MKTLIAILLLTLPLSAQAAPRRVNVKVVVADSTPTYWPAALSLAFAKLRGVKVAARVTRIGKLHDAGMDRSLQGFPQNGQDYLNAVPRTKNITLVIAGPLAGTYFAGLTEYICHVNNAAAMVFADDSDFAKTGDAIAHELAHLLGASHDDHNLPNLMQSWYGYGPVTDFVNLWWASPAGVQVAGCLRGQFRSVKFGGPEIFGE